MTTPRDCRPPPNTPDGKHCWLYHSDDGEFCVAIWTGASRKDALWWWPHGGRTARNMARDGWRFHSIAEPPHGQ